MMTVDRKAVDRKADDRRTLILLLVAVVLALISFAVRGMTRLVFDVPAVLICMYGGYSLQNGPKKGFLVFVGYVAALGAATLITAASLLFASFGV